MTLTRFFDALYKWWIFLPKDLIMKLHSFVTTMRAISINPNKKRPYLKSVKDPKDPDDIIIFALTEVIKQARNYLETEPLTQNISNLIGKIPEKKKQSSQGYINYSLYKN